ncbi:hemagglutinin repeat-containing protein [Legionella lytica]|uniref:Hemagglutinin repeat-containing protein n=1 Tax=Legionella lytica TaxID=96232 RepID=A0ABY4Y701_9GAMM|nr:hemagglutinin repeat-containing protein [Legionella lytica]USQ13010.1 hemagglutinin repeat-containing protein [Legionella lytica]
MASAIKVLTIGMHDLGVLPREVNADYLAEINWFESNQEHAKAAIQPDKNGEYNITDSVIGTKSHGELYDNGIKILEWHSTLDGKLIVQSYTEKQINLFAAIKTKECFINAKGPVYIKGTLETDSVLAIDAEALWLDDEVTSQGSILLKARQGIGLLAPIKSENLIIDAAYVHQAASVETSGQFDVSAQFFKQDTSVKTIVDKLRLVSTESEMNGDFTVNNECFLTSKSSVWGHETELSTFRFLGTNHIHTGNLHLRGDTQARIGNPALPQEGALLVDEQLAIDESALVHVFNTMSSVNEIENKGELLLEQCHLEAQHIEQQGIFDASSSLIKLSDYFTHGNKALTELKNCLFIAPITYVHDRDFSIHDSAYKGGVCSVYAGSLECNSHSVIEIEELFVDEEAETVIHDSKLKADTSIKSRGRLLFDKANVETKYLRTIDGRLTSKNSVITSEVLLELNGVTDLRESRIFGDTLVLNGAVVIDRAHFKVNSLNITSQKANINSLFSNSKYLEINGGAVEDPALFRGCGFTTAILECSNHILLDDSTVYGLSEKKISHLLHAGLKLRNSKFITDDDIRNYLNGQIELEDKSVMKVRLLHSQGAMKAKDSAVFCERLKQEDASIQLETSALVIEDKLSSQRSTVELSQGSVLRAFDVALMDSSSLRLKEESALAVDSQLENTVDSTIISTDSKVQAKKFTALGRTELCSSLLSAKELSIYDQFSAHSMSMVTVEGLIDVALDAQIKLEKAALTGDAISILGKVDVVNSAITAQNELEVFSDASLALAGVTQVEANDMHVMGALVVHDAPQEEQTEQESKQEGPMPFINVLHELTVAEEGLIEGRGGLCIEAAHYQHEGAVELCGKLKVTGSTLTNQGSIQAENMFLGFDSQVYNSGSLSAEEMVIHSNFFNVLGQTYAKRSLSVAGFYGANGGLIAANNYSNSTLLSVNAGLITPNLAGKTGDIFNLSNLGAVAKIAATTLLPGYSSAINLGLMFVDPNFRNSVQSLYHKLSDFNLEHYKHMRSHELMAELSCLKSLISTAYGAANMACAVPSELSHLSDALSSIQSTFLDKTLSLYDIKSAAAGFDYKNFAMRSAGAVLGCYSDDSLINLNIGGILSSNTSKRSLFSFNSGAEFSAFSHNINNQAFFNSGWSGGGDANFSTQYGYNEGTLEGLNRFSYRANRTVNTGTMRGEQACVMVDSLEQEGTLHLSHGFAKIAQFTDSDDAITEFSDMFVTGVDYTSTGHLEAQRTFLDYEHQINLGENFTAHTSHLSMKAHEVTIAGKIQHEEGLFIEADKVILTEGSVIRGERTSDDELFVPKVAPAQTTETVQEVSTTEPVQETEPVEETNEQAIEVKKEFNPHHVLQIKAKEVMLDGTMSGGDYTLIQGIETKPEPSPLEATSVSASEDTAEQKPAKFDKLVIGEHADITLSYGSITGHQVVNDGHVNLDSFSLDIDSLQQNNTQVLDKCSGEVTQFRDSETSNTRITQSALTGNSFVSTGAVDSQKTSFHYSEEFLTTATSEFKSDDSWITTDHFQVGGKVDYQHLLSVKAETVSLQAGSSINGKKTAEDELFVPKENSETDTTTPVGETPAGETPEDKKEFKPQHIFAIEAKKVQLNGKLTGGDFTSIHGKRTEEDGVEKTEKCELLEVGTSAEIDLTHGFISAETGDITGITHLSGFDVGIDRTKIHHGGDLSLEKSVFNGTLLGNADGTFNLDHSNVTITDIVLSQYGREHIVDSTVTTNKLVDYSQLSYQGQTTFFTKHYEHAGRISVSDLPRSGTATRNIFAVQADTANLHGSSNLDNAIFDIKHLANANQFISGSGQYSSYGVSGSLEFDTTDYMDLTLPFYRRCDLTVKASGITTHSDYISDYTLKLISTDTDINLLSTLSGANILVKSAGAIRTNNQIYAAGLVCFEAAGGFYNVGGSINGNILSIKASEIINITPGSVPAPTKKPGGIWEKVVRGVPTSPFPRSKPKDTTEPPPNPWGIPMGSSGVINGRSETYMEATSGNIVNCGGVIRGGAYTQLLAAGDIINKCNVSTHRGPYGQVTTFDPGLIAGGGGLADTDGIGLYLKANGMVRSDASNFIANGSNYIYGRYGIDLEARQETHVSKVKKTKTWYGKSSESVTTTTSVSHSNVQSFGGINTLVAEEGGVTSVATHFISPGGTQVSSRDTVLLYSLKSQTKKHKSSSSFWGLSKHSIDEKHEEVAPTLFVDNGVTRIYSTQGSIDARGAYFAGNGDLDMRAEHGRISFGTAILDHEVIEKSRGIGVSVPGMGAWSSWKSGGSFYDAMSAEDATLSKLNSMLGSNNTTELLANASNLGINLYNTTSSFMRGLSDHTLTSEILARYGLGGTGGKGFSPTINVTMTESTTKTKYQTQGVGGVNRGGNVYLEAGEGIDLENGVRVHAGGNMVVNAPEIVARSAELHSSVDQTVTSQSVGVSPTGQIQDASFAYSHTSTKSTQHVNAELSAGGHMELGYKGGAMHQVTLDGARIVAGSLDAKIEHLSIIDKQDLSTTETESGQVSLSGQISAYVGKGNSAVVREHSGMYVADNTGHSVVIDEAHMTGSEMLINGGVVEITKLVSEKLVDHQSYSGMGVSLNVHDLQRLAGQQASNATGEQAIAVAEVTFDKIDRQVEHTPVVYGENGAQIVIKEVVGEVHTESANGATVLKNDELHVTVDVPVTNSDYMQKSVENIQSGAEKIATALGLKGVPETKLPEQREPVLPSRREEEEEEEEEELGEKTEKENENDRERSVAEKEAAAALQELLSLIPEKNKRDIEETAAEIVKSSEKGKNTSVLEQKLKTQILSAVSLVVKASSEDTWARLTKKIGADSADKLAKILSSPDGAGVKAYMGSRGIIYISFIFNLYGASLGGKEDVWGTAMQNTAGDLTINFALKSATGAFAGPIGWVLVGIGVLDTFLYDEKVVELFQEQSKSFVGEGRKQLDEGNYAAAANSMHLASEHAQAVWYTQVIHYLGNLVPKFVERTNELGDSVGAIFPAPIIQEPKKVNRHSFFAPSDVVMSEEQTSFNQSVNEVGGTCEFK